MSWLLLILAGVFEIGWAVGLKYTEGFSKPIPTLLTVLAMIASLFLLGLATKNLPLGTAYAVWVGIGTLGTAVAGIVLFSEPIGALRIVSLFLIIAGVVGLKVSHG